MNTIEFRNVSLLLMRLSLAFVFLWHGIPKAFNFELATSKFVSMGFAGWLGPFVGWIEVIGAILLIIGIWNKWTNIVLGVVMVVAFFGVQAAKGVTAGFERDLLMIFMHVVLIAFGAGRYALDTHNNRDHY